jgi:hypothetical protein
VSASSAWSSEQRRLLAALGVPLWVRAVPVALAEEAIGMDDPALAPLRAALERAAGGRDLSALALDLEALRRDPASKRALWPKLRGLRRGH